MRPGEDASDQTRLAATCILISKLADPRIYLCDLANLGQLIEFLSAAEVQHCVLLSIPIAVQKRHPYTHPPCVGALFALDGNNVPCTRSSITSTGNRAKSGIQVGNKFGFLMASKLKVIPE